GGRTVRLKFRHRGVNQPVVELATGRVAGTSHNHGFAGPGERPGGERRAPRTAPACPPTCGSPTPTPTAASSRALSAWTFPPSRSSTTPRPPQGRMTPTRCSSGSPPPWRSTDGAEQRPFRALGGVDQGALPPAGEVADALRAEFE